MFVGYQLIVFYQIAHGVFLPHNGGHIFAFKIIEYFSIEDKKTAIYPGAAAFWFFYKFCYCAVGICVEYAKFSYWLNGCYGCDFIVRMAKCAIPVCAWLIPRWATSYFCRA